VGPGGEPAAGAGPGTGQGGFTASFSTDRDTECQRHFSAQAQGGGTVRSYDQARPLYQLGHMAGQNPDYQGRSFDQVEMDLQRGWGGEQQSRYGSWPDVRGFVQFGYQGASRGGAGSGSTGGGGGGGFQASGSTGSGGFQASVKSDESGTSGHVDASGGGASGGSSGGGTSGGFKASGGFETDR
jgi:hypothetical protein